MSSEMKGVMNVEVTSIFTRDKRGQGMWVAGGAAGKDTAIADNCQESLVAGQGTGFRSKV